MNELQDLLALIRANTPLILIETTDESRVIELFKQALVELPRPLYSWTITDGLKRQDMDIDEPSVAPEITHTLRDIQARTQTGIFVLFDAMPYLGYPGTQRLLRDIIQRDQCREHVLVMVGSKLELPDELQAHAARFSLKLPDAKTLLGVVKKAAMNYGVETGKRVTFDTEAVKQIVRNLHGLSMHDAKRIAEQLIYDDGVLAASDLPKLAKLKFELLNQSNHLHYQYDTADFNEVAGASKVKRWIQQRQPFFSGTQKPLPGMDPPKGVLLLGVQGCGKSMLAKAIAGGFGVPLVRLDFGGLYNKYHGETERNLREALEATEQIAPCVLWIDEVEKGISGGDNSDGGVSKRVLGHLLTWMAERKAKVFLVATANQVHQLPAELLRKGRFDEIFFVDLPSPQVREMLFQLHLDRRKLDSSQFNLPKLAQQSDGFSGAEIEQAIVSGLYAAHAQSSTLNTDIVLEELKETRPLSVVMAEQVAELRAWAAERTVPAD